MYWVVGDVHGMLEPLLALIEAIDSADPQRELIFTGDLVNRGPDSFGVIELMLTLPRVHCVRGNHDDIFDLILSAGAEMTPAAALVKEATSALRWFVRYGLDLTLAGYGLDAFWLAETVERTTIARLRELHHAVPLAHRTFLAQLPLTLERLDFFVVHGHFDPLLPSFDPSPAERIRAAPALQQDLLWGRFTADELGQEKQWGRRGFFGHTPVHEYFAHASSAPNRPLIGRDLVLVDTGCAMTPYGRLSAVCVEDGRIIQAERDGRIVPR